MGYRLTKIYTRKGDDGKTRLEPRKRIFKDDLRLEVIGTIDELNSVIGMLLAYTSVTSSIRQTFIMIQQDLFNIGGELCPPYRRAIFPDKIVQLEHWLDEWNATLPPLKEFILPGGNHASATCHLARTVCRRAERCLVRLHKKESVSDILLSYINRLSDVLFVASRLLAKEACCDEIYWERD